LHGALGVLSRARRAYVSPLCYAEVTKQAPKGVRLITMHEMVSSESLLTLRQCLFPFPRSQMRGGMPAKSD